jgi:predicted MFS family arabinose efflux permease
MTHKFGRAQTGWIGLIIFSSGLLALAFVQPIQLTIAAAFVTSFGTSTVINSFVVSLNDHYGKLAPIAVGQANGVSSAGYVVGTATIGTIAQTAPDFWRMGLVLILPLAMYLYFFRRERSVEAHTPSTEGPQSGRLSLAFWITWAGFVATIGTEFATSFWAAALVKDRTNSSPAISTIAIIALGLGMALGRFFGGRVLHRFSADNQLQIALGVQALGFFGLWFSHQLWLSLIMLLVSGLGIAMQFALTSLRLINRSEGRAELAIGRSSLAAGLAIAGAPFLLGVLGDNYGISRAYLMVPILILVASLVVKFVPSHIPQSELDELEI